MPVVVSLAVTVTSSPIRLASTLTVPTLALSLVTVKPILPEVLLTTPLTSMVSVAVTVMSPTANNPEASMVTVAGSMVILPPESILVKSLVVSAIVKAVTALMSTFPAPVVIILPSKLVIALPKVMFSPSSLIVPSSEVMVLFAAVPMVRLPVWSVLSSAVRVRVLPPLAVISASTNM